MYKTSSTLIEPEHTRQPLWRYMSEKRLLELLSTGELFFCHLPTLEDKYEGALTRRSQEHLADWFQQHNQCSRREAYKEVASYQECRKSFYVNCWHMNEHESYLMWKAYAKKGFAIKSNFERLLASFNNSESAVTGGVVKYVDFSRELTPVGNVFNHVATKDMPYCDEREFRLVFWDVDPENKNHPKLANGVRVHVDIKMLISSVILSPYHETLNIEIERLLESKGIKIEYSVVSTTQKTKE